MESHPRLGRSRTLIAVFTMAPIVIVGIVGANLYHRARTTVAHEKAMSAAVAGLRRALATYATRHHTGPATLAELVRDGELRAIPVDPVTASSATWKEMREEVVRIDDFQAGGATTKPSAGIADVHSGAAGNDRSGRPWSDY